MSPRPPIVVLGAHRSGTSAVARVLEQLGVFVGVRLDPNHEARFFLELDEWLLAQSGARWDQPAGIKALIADERQSALAAEYLALCLRTPRAIGYLGLRRWLSTPRIDRLATPWGFKDPRATFTLPIWLRLFPETRVVHVHRHGVDVAQSLCKRHRDHLARSADTFARNRGLLGLLRKRAGFGDSPRLSTLLGGFTLWEEYVREARRHVAAAGTRAVEVRYEELAAQPNLVVRDLARACGLTPDDAAIARAAASIAPDRAGAHRNDPELRAFAAEVEDRVRALRDVEASTIPAEPRIRAGTA